MIPDDPACHGEESTVKRSSSHRCSQEAEATLTDFILPPLNPSDLPNLCDEPRLYLDHALSPI